MVEKEDIEGKIRLGLELTSPILQMWISNDTPSDVLSETNSIYQSGSYTEYAFTSSHFDPRLSYTLYAARYPLHIVHPTTISNIIDK